MKFYPPKIVRFYYRYVLIFILCVLPLLLAVEICKSSPTIEGSILVLLFVCIVLSLIGGLLIHIGFWEKFFAVLILAETEIRWKCPFRKTRVILLSNCLDIGAYLENTNNGIPSEQIYFSDHRFPKQNMSKQGIVKPSQHLIKFWYTDQLSNYIIRNYSSKLTGCLNAYRLQRKK